MSLQRRWRTLLLCLSSPSPVRPVFFRRMHNRDSHDGLYVTWVYKDCQSDEKMGKNTGGLLGQLPKDISFQPKFTLCASQCLLDAKRSQTRRTLVFENKF